MTHLSCSAGDVIFLSRAIISALCQVNISSRSLRRILTHIEMFLIMIQIYILFFSGDPDEGNSVLVIFTSFIIKKEY